MNSNIEKILSISAGALLAAFAFTVFFSNYNRHLDYINSSRRVFEEDIMVEISGEEQECLITGSEIIHSIIEAKTQKEVMELQSLYSAGSFAPPEISPEMLVDGKKADLVELSDIDPESYWQVRYEADFRGKIVRIVYSSR
jgi:hypothetical protein